MSYWLKDRKEMEKYVMVFRFVRAGETAAETAAETDLSVFDMAGPDGRTKNAVEACRDDETCFSGNSRFKED